MEAPIGIFDAGVGGLTVAQATPDQLWLGYLADPAQVPSADRDACGSGVGAAR